MDIEVYNNVARTPDVTVKQVSETVLNEILGALVEAELLPSSDLLKLLVDLTGKTELLVKSQYKIFYKDKTGTDDDPFITPSPMIG